MITTVINLADYLGESVDVFNQDNKLLLFSYEDVDGAFLVDDTDNVIDISEEDVQILESDEETQTVVSQGETLFPLLEINSVIEELS